MTGFVGDNPPAGHACFPPHAKDQSEGCPCYCHTETARRFGVGTMAVAAGFMTEIRSVLDGLYRQSFPVVELIWPDDDDDSPAPELLVTTWDNRKWLLKLEPEEGWEIVNG